MAMVTRLTIASALLVAATAYAQPGADDFKIEPPGSVPAAEPTPAPAPRVVKRPHATTNRWGGGVRLTGMSGIGALPGVNYGGELAGLVRRDEMFVELGFGRWRPENTYVVAQTPERIELGLDAWTLRGGWASMSMPLRGWLLAEVGELASARGMPGVVARMMTGETPRERRWQALGAGFGVAWPMTDNARLVGMVELAIPTNREQVSLDAGDMYQPDPLAVRSSAGLEIGWR